MSDNIFKKPKPKMRAKSLADIEQMSPEEEFRFIDRLLKSDQAVVPFNSTWEPPSRD